MAIRSLHFRALLLFACLLVLAGCEAGTKAPLLPTSTPTVSFTPTPSPTPTLTLTPTSTPTVTPLPTTTPIYYAKPHWLRPWNRNASIQADNLKDLQLLATWISSPVSQFFSSPDGNLMGMVTFGGRVYLYDTDSLEERLLITLGEEIGWGTDTYRDYVAYFSDEHNLAIKKGAWCINFIDLTSLPNFSFNPIATRSECLRTPIANFDISAKTKRMALNVWKEILLFDYPSSSKPVRLKVHTGSIGAAKFSPDGTLLVSAGFDDGRIGFLKSNGSLFHPSIDTGEKGFINLSIASDNSLVAAGTDTGKILLIDMNEFKVIRQWQAHLARIPALAFSRDGKMLISSSGDGSVKFWRVPDGTLLKSLDGYASEVSAFALFPQENALILGTAEGIVEVWGFLP